MDNIKLTPEQFADIVRHEKPHLIEIEEQVQNMKDGYGEVTVILTIRARKVTNMSFVTKDTWLLQKDKPSLPAQI